MRGDYKCIMYTVVNGKVNDMPYEIINQKNKFNVEVTTNLISYS